VPASNPGLGFGRSGARPVHSARRVSVSGSGVARLALNAAALTFIRIYVGLSLSRTSEATSRRAVSIQIYTLFASLGLQMPAMQVYSPDRSAHQCIGCIGLFTRPVALLASVYLRCRCCGRHFTSAMCGRCRRWLRIRRLLAVMIGIRDGRGGPLSVDSSIRQSASQPLALVGSGPSVCLEL